PRLLAADEELRGAVDRGEVGRGTRDVGRPAGGSRLLRAYAPNVQRPTSNSFHVLPHPFPSAFAPEAALAVAAESRGRVEEIGRVHPPDTGFDLRRDVERKVDARRPDARRE